MLLLLITLLWRVVAVEVVVLAVVAVRVVLEQALLCRLLLEPPTQSPLAVVAQEPAQELTQTGQVVLILFLAPSHQQVVEAVVRV